MCTKGKYTCFFCFLKTVATQLEGGREVPGVLALSRQKVSPLKPWKCARRVSIYLSKDYSYIVGKKEVAGVLALSLQQVSP